MASAATLSRVDLSAFQHRPIADQLRIQNQYEDDAYKGVWTPVHSDENGTCMAFSSCGRYLAVGTRRAQVLVWNILTHQSHVLTLSVPNVMSSQQSNALVYNGVVHAVAWSSSSRLIFVSHGHQLLSIFDVETGHCIRSLQIGATARKLRVHPQYPRLVLVSPAVGMPLVLDWSTGALVQLPDELSIPSDAIKGGQRLLRGQAARCDAWWSPVPGCEREIVVLSSRGDIGLFKVGLVEQHAQPHAAREMQPQQAKLHFSSVVRVAYFKLPGRPAALTPEMCITSTGWAYLSLREPSQLKGVYLVHLPSLRPQAGTDASPPQHATVLTEGPYKEPVEATLLLSPCADGQDDSLVFCCTKVSQGRYKGHVICFRRATASNAIGDLLPRKGPAGGDVELIEKHPYRGMICALTSRGSVYILSQPFETAWQGPAYPAGFQLCVVNKTYEEGEDEFDLVRLRPRGGGSGAGSGSGSGAGVDRTGSGTGSGARASGDQQQASHTGGARTDEYYTMRTRVDERELRFRKTAEPDFAGHVEMGARHASKGSARGVVHKRASSGEGAGSSAIGGLAAPASSIAPFDDFSAYQDVAAALSSAVEPLLLAAKSAVSSADSAVACAQTTDERTHAQAALTKAHAELKQLQAQQTMPALVGQLCRLIDLSAGAIAGVAGRPLALVLPPEAPGSASGAAADAAAASLNHDTSVTEQDATAQHDEEEEGAGAGAGAGGGGAGEQKGRGRIPPIPGLAYLASANLWAAGLDTTRPLRAHGHLFVAQPVSTSAEAGKATLGAASSSSAAPASPAPLPSAAAAGAAGAGAVGSRGPAGATHAQARLQEPARVGAPAWLSLLGSYGDAPASVALARGANPFPMLQQDWRQAFGLIQPHAAVPAAGTAQSGAGSAGAAGGVVAARVLRRGILRGIAHRLAPKPAAQVAQGGQYMQQFSQYATAMRQAITSQGVPVKATGAAGGSTVLGGAYPLLPRWHRCTVVLEALSLHNTHIDDRARRVKQEQQRITAEQAVVAAEVSTGKGVVYRGKGRKTAKLMGPPNSPAAPSALQGASDAIVAGQPQVTADRAAALAGSQAANEAAKLRRREQYRLRKEVDAAAGAGAYGSGVGVNAGSGAGAGAGAAQPERAYKKVYKQHAAQPPARTKVKTEDGEKVEEKAMEEMGAEEWAV